MENSNNLSKLDKERIIERNIETCKQIANDYVNNWKQIVDGEVIDGCAYLRLSTDNQVAVEKGSLEQQVHIAIDEAESRSKKEGLNYRITDFYIEPGLTGRNDRRPSFIQMKRNIKKGKHKFVVVKEIARLFRDAGLWKEFFRLCIDTECEIMIRGFPFNPNDPTQILQLDILAAFAEYESNLISKRTRESNYSALVNSGKLNSTKNVLGLDQKVINGEKKVGYYVPNEKELKVVEWIMETFLKYSSYQRVLEECEKFEIKNKTGKPFKLNSLKTLLTNQKYIGIWEANKKNKEKNQDRLMPYERYQKIDLPHGEILSRDLWDKVQARVELIKGNNGKNSGVKRVYPLQGVLKYKDGSNFQGVSGKSSKLKKHCYYKHKATGLLIADELEQEAMKVVSMILSNSKEIQDSIANRGFDVKSTIDKIGDQKSKVQSKIDQLFKSKERLHRRLDFLLDGDSLDDANNFREEFKIESSRINSEMDSLNSKLMELTRLEEDVELDSFDWKKVGSSAQKIQELLLKHDPVALKSAYKQLFKAIIVNDLNNLGKRELKFILNDGDDFSFVSPEGALTDNICNKEKMG